MQLIRYQHVPHEVLNQPPPLTGYNLFSTDRALREGVAREGAGWACEELHEYGQKSGTAEALDWGVAANQNPPVLHTHDRYGHRRDEVEFHPAGTTSCPSRSNTAFIPFRGPIRDRSARRPRRPRHARLRMEAGHVCPVSMTYSAVPVLRRDPELAAEWEPRLSPSSTTRACSPHLRKPAR